MAPRVFAPARLMVSTKGLWGVRRTQKIRISMTSYLGKFVKKLVAVYAQVLQLWIGSLFARGSGFSLYVTSWTENPELVRSM